jgi:hypoxanthine phosphoribosyltransferase
VVAAGTTHASILRINAAIRQFKEHIMPSKEHITPEPQQIGIRLISRDQIQKRVRQLASKIVTDKAISVFWIANGAQFFCTDLFRANGTFHHKDTTVSVIRARRYSGTLGSDLEHDAQLIDYDFHRNRHILLVDDILDKGITLFQVAETMRRNLPKDTRIDILPLLQKIGAQDPNLSIPLLGCGFEIHGNPWLFGYGMDHQNVYRPEPSIWMLRRTNLPADHPREGYPSTKTDVKVTVEGMYLDEWDDRT